MFDELFPGMGMMGAYGMNPMMMGMPMGAMFGGMQQYRQPGADVFSDMGLMTPQQQQFQGIELQNMLQQQQFARQQQLLAMRNMSMNMGANAAQVGSGFAGPMLMQMGGLQPSWGGQLTNGIDGLISAYQNRGQPQGGMPQGGMVPQAAGAAQGVDPGQIINDSIRAAGGDPAKGYKMAADTLSQLADTTGNDNYRTAAARLRIKAFQTQQSEASSAANTAKANADAQEAASRAQATTAAISAPRPMGVAHSPDGQTGIAWSQYDPQTKSWETKSGYWGVPIQYQIPTTPNGQMENQNAYRQTVMNGIDSQRRINSLIGLINSKGGAAQGWAAEGVGFANDLLGTIQQLAPGRQLDSTGEAALKQYNGTFQNWANKTELSESYWSDLTMGLAGVYAHGQRISNVDIKRAADTLGESVGNPKSIVPVLQSVSQRMSQDIDTQGGAYGVGGTGPYQNNIKQLNKYYHDSIAHLQQAQTNDASSGGGGTILTYDPATRTFK
ncbi:MAG: hypothetical protein KGL39_08905 [Patescibacteria group bacterium]|nr:hypothetical protein [Patescibacteria group bacterium]